ncbi:UDP-N-acetylmuramoyl-tripeptide--D-alanyl-D-alanine ligase [Nonomuraea gerenzanensis]|uniref:UDP-N-acetylmuramoyl-tripeptide--D-alanyl-D- alanine ligase n=1 Tax=Nonomuraea gerenzanensis TaxID=93944 RepID=UPI001CD95D90|nr:UDP-N-acetylmuramoyl-tripeptide--D-alanyl-D-alanine ligase [Nonomuraea gerenzanensis]UBU16907.1 UDP-N-acetylmuramoyl-tripeptide--D-alanyl-D-alanine ligase [Nonomuraea gerenzanensis]
MIPLPLARIAEMTSGALSGMADPRAVVRGPVVIDSRAVEPGSLFVAIRGARVDGHDFAAQAVRAGAVAVLASRPVDAPAVIVSDTAAALAELAAAQVRMLSNVTVIGVTGSAGKTSTKDLLARLTARIGSTIAPQGSFNNELGHPLTVLRGDLDTRFMVLELAARNVGHIKELTRIAPPQIGVVLNVGTAHLGVFGGKEAIAKAKGELVEALPRSGVAVLNADDPLVRGMASRTEARVTYFGRGESASIRAEGVVIDARGRASFTLRTPSGAAHVSLKLYGEHVVENALAAAAAGYELGLPVATIAEELSEATPRSRWRMEVTDRADGVTVLNDAYNANPDSMKAAFSAFEVLGKGRRRFAVIAALRELGDEGPALNAELGRLAGGAGLAGLVVAGPDAEPVLAGAHAAVQERTAQAAQPPAQPPAMPPSGPQAPGGPAPVPPGAPLPGPQGAVPGAHGPVPHAQVPGPQGTGGPAPVPPGGQAWHAPDGAPAWQAPQGGGPQAGGPQAGGPPGAPAYPAQPGYGQPTRIVHVPDAEAAAAELAAWLRPGDAVLIKGPRAMGLERTAELLLGGAAQ